MDLIFASAILGRDTWLPNTRKWLIDGFRPVHTSYDLDFEDLLVKVRFNTNIRSYLLSQPRALMGHFSRKSLCEHSPLWFRCPALLAANSALARIRCGCFVSLDAIP